MENMFYYISFHYKTIRVSTTLNSQWQWVLCCYAAICRKIPIDRLYIVSYVPPTVQVQSLQPLSMQDGDEKHQNENENQFGIKDDGYLRERLHFICWEYPLIGHITALKPVMCNSNCISLWWTCMMWEMEIITCLPLLPGRRSVGRTGGVSLEGRG